MLTVRIFPRQRLFEYLPGIQGIDFNASHTPPSLHNKEQTEATTTIHRSLPGADNQAKTTFPFQGSEKAPGLFPQTPPLLHSSLRTPGPLEPLNTLPIAKKPSLSHTQDGSQSPTGGNSCATTAAKPAFRLRVSPLAQRERARQLDNAVSKSDGGALRCLSAADRRCAEV